MYIRWYPITTAIMIINLILWLLMEIFGSSKDVVTLIEFGAMYYSPLAPPAEIWRYVTAMFLHIGFEHLLFNSFALFVFAPPLEVILGRWRYIGFYFVCGIAGNALSGLVHTEPYVGAGASGAIYGIFAAYLFIAIFRKDLFDYQTKQTIWVIIIAGFVYSLVVRGVDLSAHLGGFIAGVGAMAVIVMSIKHKRRR